MSGYYTWDVKRTNDMRSSTLAFVIGLVLFACIDVSVQQQASFIEEPQNVTIKEGETAMLRCILDREVRDCSWLRDGTTFAMGGRYNYAPDTKDGRQTSNCSIVVVNFNRQRDGVAWECVIPGTSESLTKISAKAYLIALVQPSDPVIQLNRQTINQLSYPLRTATDLTCVSRRGNPAAELSWELDGQPLQGTYSVQKVHSGPSSGDSQLIENPMYDAMLKYDLMNDGPRLETVKQLKCIVKHPSYPTPVAVIATITRDYPTRRVQAYVDGSNESTLEVDSDRTVTLRCAADGRPTPKYEWHYRVDDAVEWGVYDVAQNITVVGRGGKFRCQASNRLNTNAEMITAQEIVLSVRAAVESSGMGITVFIIIAIVVIVAAALLIILLMYRRKSWVFAPKPVPLAADKDAEAANGGEPEKTDEKTALSQESQYDNVNGKEDELNGKKISESPVKNDQNANKQPTEVVYAQLDLVKTSPKTTSTTAAAVAAAATAGSTKIPPSPEYEKTEYAEIRFNNKENKV